MTPLHRFGVAFAIIFTLLTNVQSAFAQNCYYPNGNIAEGMAACTTNGGTCCPLNWDCISNGLCYLDNADYYGRYTCTDQDWASDSECPQYCTQNNTAAGNEAVQHCSDGSWCCDGNRDVKNNCCDNSHAVVLDMGNDFSQIGFISSTAPPTSVTDTLTSSGAASITSTTSASTTSSTSQSPTPKATPTTITTSAVTSNSEGVATTIISVITSTPTPTSTPVDPPRGSNKLSLAVGLGVGIPAGVILASAALGFFLWHLRRKRQLHEKPPLSEPPGLVSMYRSADDTPELDSATPPNKPERKSELYGSAPTHCQHSPAISSVTGVSEPPYSPTSFVGPGGVLGQVKEEPSELWGGEIPAQQWPSQQPYRAPEPDQRMSQTFRVSQQDFTPYRPRPEAGTDVEATQPKDY